MAVALGWVAGDQYNLFDRVDVPRIPIASDDITLGGIITAIAVLLGTLLAAMLGGKVGRRYHSRVDAPRSEAGRAGRGGLPEPEPPLDWARVVLVGYLLVSPVALVTGVERARPVAPPLRPEAHWLPRDAENPLSPGHRSV